MQLTADRNPSREGGVHTIGARWSRVNFSVALVVGAVMSSAFAAEEMSPLALMIRPRGSSPHHSVALVLARTAIRASKPLPLVHITSSAPSIS